MRRRFSGAILAVCLAVPAWAAPPSVDIPAETVATTDFTVVVPKTDAKGVSYIGLSGVDPFPSALLKDSKTFVLPTRGLPAGRYVFAGVASLNDEHTVFRFAITVGKPPVLPPPVDPPVDPPPPERVFYYFLVIRPDGPAAPAFTRTMSMPGWEKLRGLGHSIKDKTVSQARLLNVNLPAGTPLPCVVTLKINATGSVIARGPVALPTTDDDIVALPEFK